MGRKSRPLGVQFREHVLEVLNERPAGFFYLWSTFRPPYARGNASGVLHRMKAAGEIEQPGGRGPFRLPEAEQLPTPAPRPQAVRRTLTSEELSLLDMVASYIVNGCITFAEARRRLDFDGFSRKQLQYTLEAAVNRARGKAVRP